MTAFKEFPLSTGLIQNLEDSGFEVATPIQEKAIPLVLKGSDLLAIAQTGTGKTAAFSIPLIQQLLSKPPLDKTEIRSLIIAPTRELCVQVHSVISHLTKGLSLKSCALFGGVDQAEQVKQLREKVDIVVATPGRLLDLHEQKLLKLSTVELLVLDEADKMLGMGFMEEILEIISKLPQKKQSLLFSATMPASIESFAMKVLKNPEKVEVTPVASTPQKLEQKLIYCHENHKFQLLKKIIKESSVSKILVFTRTKEMANKVVDYLAQNRVASKTFHSDMKQAERERALGLFKDGSMKVLVATDIASRGIDVEGISHVINFELPLDPESYVHRIGRTARSSKTGIALSFCDDGEKGLLQRIETLLGVKLKSEKFEGKKEVIKFKPSRKITPPTPGKSQEPSSYLDHSKRQKPLKVGEKPTHPGFRKTKKKRK